MSVPTCVLLAAGRRFAAKRYLATSTLVPEVVGERHFEFAISHASGSDHERVLADLERFLDAPRLKLDRLFAFPGVERVSVEVRLARRAGDASFSVPARICAALARHGLELTVRFL